MTTFTVNENIYGIVIISKIDDDGMVWTFQEDESNPDYLAFIEANPDALAEIAP